MFRRRDILAFLPAAALIACQRGPQPEEKLKTIGIAYALGGRGDRSYNDALALALPELSRSFDVREYAPVTLEDYANALTTLAAGPAGLIICVGFLYDSYVNQLAPRHGNKRFCVLDGLPTPSNAFGVQFRVGEASALAGVVAADKSKSKILGFVGGSDIPPIAPFVDGFEAGARRFDPEVRVLRSYIGSGGEAFTNAVKGRDHALRLLRQGADVLFHAAGTSGDGVIAAARDAGKLAIGVDVDQSKLAPPGTVITSVLKKLDIAALRFARAHGEGGSTPSGVVELGYADHAVDIIPPTGISPRAELLIRRLRQEFLAK